MARKSKQWRRIRGKAALDQVNKDVQGALRLLDSERADGIIGDATAEHKVLMKGVQGVVSLTWAFMTATGLRDNDQTRLRMAQGQAMLLTMCHYAYALGIEKGRGEAMGG